MLEVEGKKVPGKFCGSPNDEAAKGEKMSRVE